ncbi:MAG: deoxyuridine 5'-triphosphate nucleotidohydrolase [Candidatus Korarchaeota archaeon]|nr:deoxyuridine 5'-triphosphate nucleotidohydrolase [Candidatus Korarchaeota archaeon]
MAWPGELLSLFIRGMRSPEDQVQPAGVDLSVSEVYRAGGPGEITLDGKRIPGYVELEPGGGAWRLGPGYYVVRFAEAVEVPLNAVGICLPRSSLLRMGAALHCALWDPGYKGRGYALLTVYNEHGIVVERGARIAQMIYVGLSAGPRRGYEGAYQGEGLWR